MNIDSHTHFIVLVETFDNNNVETLYNIYMLNLCCDNRFKLNTIVFHLRIQLNQVVCTIKVRV